MQQVALITVHGMGETESSYANQLIKTLRNKLGSTAKQLHHDRVYYQEVLQYNEERVWQATAHRLRWNKLRRFILFGFADAVGLEHRKEQKNSGYLFTQLKIARALYVTKQHLKSSGKVVLLAHSLGGHVLSCYLWDAASAREGKPVFAGIWQNIRAYQAAISGDQLLTDDDIAFLQGSALAGLITTGCNIPIFVAAHASEQIIPFTRPNPDFFWLNYYDKDDVLGWPLADLSVSYQQLVTDFSINANSGLFGWITASWNPFSHNQYWQDKQIIAAITQQLKNIISGQT